MIRHRQPQQRHARRHDGRQLVEAAEAHQRERGGDTGMMPDRWLKNRNDWKK
jgi:hypothetical protein